MSLRPQIARTLYSVSRPHMMQCLNELRELQWLSQDELAMRQQQWLHRLLEYANTYVPYYRDLFKEIGFHPDDFASDPSCFEQLPFLTKDVVIANSDRFITTDPAKQDSLIKAKTGGTTGEPMRFMQDRAYDDYRTANLFHQMEWSGWKLGQPQGWLWGHVLAGGHSEPGSTSSTLRNWMVSRFNSNAFYLTPESMEKFAVQLEENPNSLVWSYVSTMYRFAQFVQQRGRPIRVQAIYTAAEPLYDHHRQFIEGIFGCRVFNSYSSVEIGHIGCECDRHNGLHILVRNCYLEVLDANDQQVQPGTEGEFVLTNLTNLAFPFIRYRLQDGGRLRAEPCTCGRGLLMLDVVEGRIIDSFKTRDGKTVWGAFAVPMVPTLGSIKQYQIVQTSLDTVALRIVTDEPVDLSRFAEIQQAFKIALGENVEVTLEYVDSLPSSPTGKHRYVVSEVA